MEAARAVMEVMVDEALRATKILSTVEAVDPERLGLSGMSLGGNVTWYGMACELSLRAAVPVCGGVGSLRRQILEGDPERFKVYQPESNHVYKKQYFEWMVQWFKRFC